MSIKLAIPSHKWIFDKSFTCCFSFEASSIKNTPTTFVFKAYAVEVLFFFNFDSYVLDLLIQ